LLTLKNFNFPSIPYAIVNEPRLKAARFNPDGNQKKNFRLLPE
jgi:hypothetical protein